MSTNASMSASSSNPKRSFDLLCWRCTSVKYSCNQSDKQYCKHQSIWRVQRTTFTCCDFLNSPDNACNSCAIRLVTLSFIVSSAELVIIFFCKTRVRSNQHTGHYHALCCRYSFHTHTIALRLSKECSNIGCNHFNCLDNAGEQTREQSSRLTCSVSTSSLKSTFRCAACICRSFRTGARALANALSGAAPLSHTVRCKARSENVAVCVGVRVCVRAARHTSRHQLTFAFDVGQVHLCFVDKAHPSRTSRRVVAALRQRVGSKQA